MIIISIRSSIRDELSCFHPNLRAIDPFFHDKRGTLLQKAGCISNVPSFCEAHNSGGSTIAPILLQRKKGSREIRVDGVVVHIFVDFSLYFSKVDWHKIKDEGKICRVIRKELEFARIMKTLRGKTWISLSLLLSFCCYFTAIWSQIASFFASCTTFDYSSTEKLFKTLEDGCFSRRESGTRSRSIHQELCLWQRDKFRPAQHT